MIILLPTDGEQTIPKMEEPMFNLADFYLANFPTYSKSNFSSPYRYFVKSKEDDLYKLSLEMPGVKKQDLKITVTDNKLTIKGKSKWDNFTETLSLSKTLDAKTCKASLEDGILTLSVKQKEEEKSGAIEVLIE
jgi:HSP20 family molecular chaperone IbpA